jgi:hypothetical protein
MSGRQKCFHCGEPRAGRPLQRGTGFHVACFDAAMRAQMREAERTLLSRAERDQYWDRFVDRVRTQGARSKSVALASAPLRRKTHPFSVAIGDRLFEDV